MKIFFAKLLFGKDFASLLAENHSLKTEIETLKKELENRRHSTGFQGQTNQMLLNPPNTRNPKPN